MSSSSLSVSHGQFWTPKKLFERLLGLLGGGKGADIVLWRNKPLSARILVGVTVIWLVIEVMEYHFMTLVCHLAIVAMLGVFIWSNGAALLEMPPPNIPEVKLSAAFKKVVPTVQSTLDPFMSILHGVACGGDIKAFLLAIASLLTLSVIGSYCSFLSLLYFVFLGILTLPALYKKYQTQVDHLTDRGTRELKKLVDEKFLSVIPRSPLKEEKVQ